ncbi:MAG: hypothetical protein L0338_11880 [Acidobacteria bacterium]|nr:hypothetical protein [Acidobacteriota bacterium]
MEQFPCRALTIPKSEAGDWKNEDTFRADRRRGIFALSDGASESFCSYLWARLLVREYVSKPSPSAEWIARPRRLYHAGFNREELSWSAQGAYDRGSFATLLGIKMSPDASYATVNVVGDSIAVVVKEGAFVSALPYNRPEEFDARPLLIPSNPVSCESDKSWLGQLSSEATVALSDTRRATLLCMTDALGKWVLDEPHSRTQRLLSVSTKPQLRNLVQTERATGAMRTDDSTLLRVDLGV